VRDLLVTALFCYGVMKAFRHPYVAALLWVWIGLMNPHRLGWGFAYSIPFALMSVGVLVISMLANPKDVRWPSSGPIRMFILFAVWMGLTTAFAIHREDSTNMYLNVIKVMVMTLGVAAVVRTRKEILGLVSVIALSLAFYGAKGGWFTLITGGAFRVWGPPSTVIEGNNELAVGLIITIPLLYYMVLQADKLLELPWLEKIGIKWLKRSIVILMLLCAISAIGSHSRGALLAMIAMATMLWWRSKSKLAVGLVVLLLSPALIFFMPDEWSSRMGTIQTYETDQSAMGRINAWTMAINIANNRIFGAGFTTDSALIYQMYAPDPSDVLVAHSIYFQVLGEHGYIGLFLYLLFWFLTYRTAGRLTMVARGRPDLEWVGQLGAMIKVSIVGFAVGGAFLSLAFWDMPYYFMVLLVVTENWVKSYRADEAVAGVTQPVVSNSMGRLKASR